MIYFITQFYPGSSYSMSISKIFRSRNTSDINKRGCQNLTLSRVKICTLDVERISGNNFTNVSSSEMQHWHKFLGRHKTLY